MPALALARLIDEWAAAEPAAPVLVYNESTVTAGMLAAESRRAAGGLARLGVGAGDRVALWLPNAPAWLALLFGCARLGAIAFAVNTRFRASEVADILARSRPRVLVMWPGFRNIDFPGILAEVPASDLTALETVIAYDERDEPTAVIAGKPVRRYRDIAAAAPLEREAGGGESPAVIFTTSGTTKAPKFVLHAQRSLAAHAHDVARAFDYGVAATVLLHALPFCGTFGLAQALAMIAARRPMVLQTVFDAEAAVQLINRHRVTTTSASDDMLHRIFAAGRGERPFPSLRWAGYASFNAAITDLGPRMAHRGVALCGLYGSSEMQALYARQRLDAPVEERATPGGVPVSPDARFRVRDPDTGKLLPNGEAGELETAGPSRMSEYFGDPAATARTLTEDGFVRMGDLAYRRPDGSFVFLTRLGDVMRLGGYLVAPAEIEDRLQSHPSVAAAQVVGAESAEGNRAVAFVVAKAGAAIDEPALQAHCGEALARYKIPARIIPLSAFPTVMSANGEKIQRARLREMAREAIAQNPRN